jgi:ribosomal protein S18 acetylase RimI-like enzyme
VLSVRPASPDDAAAVAGVHVRSWQGAYRGLLPDEYLDGLRPDDRVSHYTFGATDLSTPATAVAVEDGDICGFVTTGPCRDADETRTGEVLALYVDPRAWGAGVGARLMAEARAHLGHQGFTEALLWVLVGNDRAQRFYRIDGWQPDGGRRSDEVWGVVVDEVRFRRRLP